MCRSTVLLWLNHPLHRSCVIGGWRTCRCSLYQILSPTTVRKRSDENRSRLEKEKLILCEFLRSRSKTKKMFWEKHEKEVQIFSCIPWYTHYSFPLINFDLNQGSVDLLLYNHDNQGFRENVLTCARLLIGRLFWQGSLDKKKVEHDFVDH